MVLVSTKLVVLLGLYWMSKVGVTLGQSRECTDSVRCYDCYTFRSWRCNDGECVYKSQVCDGKSDCSDGSDEYPTTCCASTCPSDPNICIQDGEEILPGQDCRDCTDDWGNPDWWRCNNGQCLEKNNVCNGRPDCSDGSDESLAICCPSTCPSDPDICIQAGQEILPGQDCRDCTHSGGSGWRCNSGQCLEKWNVCDYSPLCSEKWGACAGNSGQCLEKWGVCDGTPDCSDGSDESPATCCASTCPSDPDICIPAGQEIKPGQDCRDCTHIHYDYTKPYQTFFLPFISEGPGWRCNSGQCQQAASTCPAPSWFTQIIRWIIPT